MSHGEAEPFYVPVFTGGDIVRLIVATYLPLCRFLRAVGALDTQVLAQRIASRAAHEKASSWDALAMALAEALADKYRPQPSSR